MTCKNVKCKIVVCPAEGCERTRRSAGNTKKRKTCSQQKGTRIKCFWSKHLRQRNKTIFTEYDRKKIKAFFCKYYFVSLPKSVYITSVLRSCLSAGYKLSESLCALGTLVHALLPGTRRNVYMLKWSPVSIFTIDIEFCRSKLFLKVICARVRPTRNIFPIKIAQKQ